MHAVVSVRAHSGGGQGGCGPKNGYKKVESFFFLNKAFFIFNQMFGIFHDIFQNEMVRTEGWHF